MRGIPKYVQTFQKMEPQEDLKEHLIKSYDLGGVLVDEMMKQYNPNAKTSITYVSVTSTPITKTKASFDGQGERLGEWIYCGHLWYVRQSDAGHEFAQYVAYNTETKTIEDIWEEEKYNKLNNGESD